MESKSEEQENKNIDDLDILEELKLKIYDAIINDETQPKVGDLLKVIELKRKLSVDGKGEKKFWAMVNKIREEALNKPRKNISIKKKTEE